MLKSGTGIKQSPKKINVPALMEEMVAAVPKASHLMEYHTWKLFNR